MDLLSGVVSGVGLGSLLTSALTHYLSLKSKQSERLYNEKREAYLGLLNALHQAAVKHSDENSKAYALWQTRVSLFGSKQVIQFAQNIVDTNEGPRNERDQAYSGLLEAMRNDLTSK